MIQAGRLFGSRKVGREDTNCKHTCWNISFASLEENPNLRGIEKTRFLYLSIKVRHASSFPATHSLIRRSSVQFSFGPELVIPGACGIRSHSPERAVNTAGPSPETHIPELPVSNLRSKDCCDFRRAVSFSTTNRRIDQRKIIHDNNSRTVPAPNRDRGIATVMKVAFTTMSATEWHRSSNRWRKPGNSWWKFVI